jgi:hypothetical protein
MQTHYWNSGLIGLKNKCNWYYFQIKFAFFCLETKESPEQSESMNTIKNKHL